MVIMPSNAKMPRIATKPSGFPDSSSADDTDQSQWPNAEDDEQTREASQLDHQYGEHD